jgi:hypothetical protein
LEGQPQQDFHTGIAPFSVPVGGFNGDLPQDQAVANSGSADFSVLIKNTPGRCLAST